MRQLPNLDAFSCAIGTGGTLAGVSEYLRKHRSDITIGHTDPKGAALHRYFENGVLESVGDSITEGIGQGRVTQNLEGFAPDFSCEIDDADALEVCYELIRNEGLSLGLSSGINVAGAEELARSLGPGHTLVTILCDSAARYQAKMFNRSFLASKNLPQPKWLESTLPESVAEALERAREES